MHYNNNREKIRGDESKLLSLVSESPVVMHGSALLQESRPSAESLRIVPCEARWGSMIVSVPAGRTCIPIYQLALPTVL